MKKNILIFSLTLFSIFLSTIIWKHISLPYEWETKVNGDSYSSNSYHSFNDILRFIIFLLIPFTTFLTLKIFFFKESFTNLKDFIFKKNSKISLGHNNKEIIIFHYIILCLLFLEFFLLDFSKLNYELDLFHEGLWLTASFNLVSTGEIWNSSYVGRGLFGNFFPYFFWNFFETESIGLTRFVKLVIILLNKILFIYIIKELALVSNLDKLQKVTFFIFSCLTVLSLTDYSAPVFLGRNLLLLLVLFFLIKYFSNPDKGKLYLPLIGILGVLSFFWYIDVGVYINFCLIIFIMHLFFQKQFKKISLLIFFIIVSWIFFFLILPEGEFSAFLQNTLGIFSSLNKIHGLIFPAPFLDGESRSTKALLLFLFSGFILLRLTLKKNNNDTAFKFSLLFIFFASIVSFNYALGRSDGVHLRHGTGLIAFLFYIILGYYLVDACKWIKNFNKKNFYKYTNIFLIVLFSSSIFLNFKHTNKNIVNLKDSFISIKKLINYEDKEFLNDDYNSYVKYLNNILKDEQCVEMFTGENALPYLIKKRTCSRHFIKYISSPTAIQNEIIEDIKSNKPNFILYNSDLDLFGDSVKRLPKVDEFIRLNYSIRNKFLHWEIYKKR